MIAREWLAGLTLFAVASPATVRGQSVAPSESNSGRLVIVGGALNPKNSAVYESIRQGRRGDGPLCVIPTAGPNPTTELPRAVADFNAHFGDASTVGVLLDVRAPMAAFDPEIAARLLTCSGYYFTGGLQSQIIRVLRPEGATTPALEAIRTRHRQGAVVAGSSAGAAIMSDPMIVGGTSEKALKTGLAGSGITLGPGLGFFQGALVDQHFLARGRIGRLVVAILQSDRYKLGFGIDENTALIVDGTRARVEGASGVILLDGRAARRDSTGNGGGGVRMHLMGTGDRFDLASQRLTIDPQKRPIARVGKGIVAPDSLFAQWQLLRLLHALCQSADSTVRVDAEGYEFLFAKDAGFDAVANEGVGVVGTPAGLTAGPFRVTIRKKS